MNHHAIVHKRSILLGWGSLVIALIVYCSGLGSDHLATNGDELLYAQITRLTATGGSLLPLLSIDGKADNTKPPLLFWQGIIATDWGDHWSLARLRAPTVFYTLLTAALLFAVGWRRSRDPLLGLQAALLFLCFFSFLHCFVGFLHFRFVSLFSFSLFSRCFFRRYSFDFGLLSFGFGFARVGFRLLVCRDFRCSRFCC